VSTPNGQPVIVLICMFRDCDWTSEDTTGATPQDKDRIAGRHLLDAHRDRLEYLWQVLETGT
jgi:hypothetical protein